MISDKLHALYLTALQMEALLKTSNRTYRYMYATLEQDIDTSLEGIAQRMIQKFNIPTDTPLDIPTDTECTVSDLSTIDPKYNYYDTVLDDEATNDPPS